MTPPAITLRAATSEDAAFLRALYRAARADEVSAWGWGAAEAEAFLDMQGEIEQRSRSLQIPRAEHRVVLLEGRPVGRLLVDRRPEETEVVDIALLPEARGRGLGAALLGDLLRECDAGGPRVVLTVRRGNRAEDLYRRLGFSVTREDDLLRTMAYGPPAGIAPESDTSRRDECRRRS